MDVGEARSEGQVSGLSSGRRLILLSFLMLFVELLLIRWAASNVVYLAYFTNFVLLASFLGVGLGFLRRGRDPDPLLRTAIALSVLLLLLLAFPVQVTQEGGRSFVGVWGTPALPIWVSLPLVFVGVVVVMTSIAQAVADVFGELAPLDAYRLDILGSIAGIVVFSSMSFLQAPPAVWGVVVAGGLWFLRRPTRGRDRAWIGAVAILLVVGTVTAHASWSPYYALSVSDPDEEGRIDLRANGLPHQSIVPLQVLRDEEAFYFDPYRRLGGRALGDVLIVGAGNGNDVAVALAQGAAHVDAVEIDPVIQRIGVTRHPNRPYDDPRVRAFVNDGRAFLQGTDRRYDLILFALPDSLTVVAGQGALRLESYLFTVEALRSVRDHLREDGVFAMYNYYRPDVFDRFAATITAAFGHPPCIDERTEQLGPRTQAVLSVARRADAIDCGDAGWVPPSVRPSIATDDRPFPYLAGRSIPTFYVWSLLAILAASIVAVVRWGGTDPREMRPFLDLFFMGVAFLLLETKQVVQFALLFGTTWFVNALVFAGILLSVYAAIEVARHVRLPRLPALYAVLALCLAGAWLVPPSTLLALPAAPRFLAAAALAFAPVFVANLVFASRFKEVASSTVAFGANLLGAMVGGLLEYAALVTGYRGLLLVVGAAYLAAFLLRPRAVAAG